MKLVLLVLACFFTSGLFAQDLSFRFGLGYATGYNRAGIAIALPMDFRLKVGKIGLEAGAFVYFPRTTQKKTDAGNVYNEKSNVLEANINASYLLRFRKNGVGVYPIFGWNTTFDLIASDQSYQRNNKIRMGLNWGLGVLIPMSEKFSFWTDIRYCNSFQQRTLIGLGFQYHFPEGKIEENYEE